MGVLAGEVSRLLGKARLAQSAGTSRTIARGASAEARGGSAQLSDHDLQRSCPDGFQDR